MPTGGRSSIWTAIFYIEEFLPIVMSTEQPFTRSGGPVAISENTVVYIRAHMNTTSYGSSVFKGSIADGFASENLDTEFAKGLEEIAPLPANCAF